MTRRRRGGAREPTCAGQAARARVGAVVPPAWRTRGRPTGRRVGKSGIGRFGPRLLKTSRRPCHRRLRCGGREPFVGPQAPSPPAIESVGTRIGVRGRARARRHGSDRTAGAYGNGVRAVARPWGGRRSGVRPSRSAGCRAKLQVRRWWWCWVLAKLKLIDCLWDLVSSPFILETSLL